MSAQGTYIDDEVDLQYKITVVVREETGMNEQASSQLAEAIVRGLARRFGTQRLYIPAPGKAARDELICREFNGRNADEVMRKHSVSRTVLYRIIKAKQR